MSYKVVLSNNFKKEAKRLIKKYPSLKSEIKELGNTLSLTPTLGLSLGDQVYKIRLAIKSKNRGKSGGARVISYVIIDETTVLLLSIYDKGDKVNILDSEIVQLLNAALKEK